MGILQMLEAEHSKKQATEIVNFIGSDQKKFDNLFSLFMNGEDKIVQRAAWPLSYAAIANPSFINKHYKSLFKKLNDPKQHDAVHRNIMKAFSEIEKYPEKHHGMLMDHCLRFVEDPKIKVAIKAYSLRTLEKLIRLYPEIISEVKIIIEEGSPNATKAYAASGKNFLKAVEKFRR